MSARLKLPAYGKRLLDERRNGRHPLEIALVYGERWWEAEQPKICIKPCDYEPGKYDFRMLAGIKVMLLDQDVGALDHDEKKVPPTFGKFYDLISEVANFAALLEITWPAKTGWPSSDVQALAFEGRWRDRIAKRSQWPRWWSDDLESRYGQRLLGLVNDFQLKRKFFERERAART